MRSALLIFTVLCITASLAPEVCARIMLDSALGMSEVYWSPEPSMVFVGSPSLIQFPDGRIIASHDTFGKGSNVTNGVDGPELISYVYESLDNGTTWSQLTGLSNQYWSTLFQVDPTSNTDVYILGPSTSYGSIAIRRSVDGGRTWTPTSYLFKGGPVTSPPNYHSAPTPVVIQNGRVYRAVENNDASPPRWPQGFKSLIISASTSSDLLDPSSWTMSSELSFNTSAVPASWGDVKSPGWLEGNAVRSPDGTKIWNILRVNSLPAVNKAAVLELSADAQNLTFRGFVENFPGALTKFTIRYDDQSQLYYTLANDNGPTPCPPDAQCPSGLKGTDANYNQCCARNRLSLHSSPDLYNWTELAQLLYDDTGMAGTVHSIMYTGFQYVDWHFDRNGADIIYAVRAGYRGPNSFHNANRLTFKRILNFRALKPSPSPQHGNGAQSSHERIVVTKK